MEWTPMYEVRTWDFWQGWVHVLVNLCPCIAGSAVQWGVLALQILLLKWGVLVLLVLLYRGVSAYDKFYCRRFLHKGNGPKAVNATLEIRRCSVLMETNRVFHSFVKVSHCAGIILALMG